MIEIKKLFGILNKDDKEENIAIGQHIDALNLRFYGGANGLSAQNIPGTTLIPNPLLPSGQNECLGACYDPIHQRIYWQNWNSNGNNGIYYYSISTDTTSRLLESFVNSQTDIFGFDLNYPATDMHIIYTTEIDGDILDFNNRNNRPKSINIKQAEDNVYGSNWLEKYLDVASEPFPIPPPVAYEDDASVTVNNVRKKLFRFKQRGWLADNQKTTYGSISEVPVPFLYTDPQVDTDPTKNCRIAMVLQTGDASIRKIEIVGQESLGNVWGNFFSIAILDKDELGIPDNDVYIYRFYNSEAYFFIDLDESILQFDRVPDRANSQALLNGNVRIYGGIQEGLDPVIPIVSMGTNTGYPLAIDCNNILSVTQYGDLGFQTGQNIKFIVLGTVNMGQTFRAAVLVGATTFIITYTSVVGDTPSTVLVGLSASATGQGFTQVSITSDTLVISRTNQILLRHDIATTDQTIAAIFTINNTAKTVTIPLGASYLPLFFKGVQFFLYANLFNPNPFTTVSASVVGSDLVIIVEATTLDEVINTTLYFVNPLNNSIPAYTSSSKENWGLMYFDEKGKTNGVTTSPDFNVTTKYLGMNKNLGTLLFLTPYVTASISHRPPLWAKTYQWVRTANLTKQSFLFWVSDRTFKDEKYAYISIESINAYKRVNSNSIISYSFVPGDRISFYVLYHTDGSPDVVYTQANPHDYEIYSEEINPDINGIIRTGQFLKIVLPDLNGVGGAFDFSNGLTLDYSNYYIELYTPAKSAVEGLDVYYEFSEEYKVVDAGLPTRFHQGMLQNQSSDLVSPATFKFNKGDAWYRTRKIGVGNTLLYDLKPDFYAQYTGPQPDAEFVVGQKLTVQAYPASDYLVQTDITKGVYSPTYNLPSWTISSINNSYTFRVRGAVNIKIISILNPTNGFVIQLYTLDMAGAVTRNVLASQTNISGVQTIQYLIDKYVTLVPVTRTYLVITVIGITFNLISGYISYLEPQKDFQIGVVDENFSDFYESKVNSNGRTDTVHPDEKTNKFGTLLRWGLAYQQNTNINQINRFPPLNFDEIDRSKGEIQRLKSRDRILRVFQNRGCGQYGVYARFVSNADGSSQLITTNDILTKSNINYYQGAHGVGTQYSSLVSSTSNDYFPDIVTGEHMRLGADGFTNLSELYKGRYYFRNRLTPYNKPYLRSNGSLSKIIGCYYPFDEQWIPVLQEGTYAGNNIDDYTYSFGENMGGERNKGFNSFFSFHPEWIISAEDIIYSWKNGNIWVHNNEEVRTNFYNEQFAAYITVVFNTNLFEKKTPESIAELASEIWKCPIIWTNVKSYAGQRQESELINEDFADFESMFHSAFLRDIHSIGGIINGDILKANWIAVKFQIDNASNEVTLSEIQLMWKDSPLTNK